MASIDGAARGNPGPAGYGALLLTASGETIRLRGYLGTATNNDAEYRALIEALELALAEGADEIEVVSDSQLLVRQVLGEYRVRHPNLLPLHRQALDLLRRFRRYTVRHVMREQNRLADRLANEAIDRAESRTIERTSEGDRA